MLGFSSTSEPFWNIAWNIWGQWNSIRTNIYFSNSATGSEVAWYLTFPVSHTIIQMIDM